MSSTAPTAALPQTRPVRRVALYLLGLIAGLQLIDPSVANVAIVAAGTDLGFSATTRALAASISTLALAATVLGSGIAADRLGRRRVLIAAMSLAIVGNAIVAVSPVTVGYLAGRALTGIGVGAALAATFAYVRFISPPEKVSSALGVWNAVMLMAMIVGVLVGGALAGANWRLAMLLVPVLAALLIPLVLLWLPPMPTTGSGRVDILGLVVIGASMVSLLLGISAASASVTSPACWGPVLGGLVGFGLFVLIESRSAAPAFPISMFTHPVFVAAVVAGIAWNLGQAVVQLSVSNFWQYVNRLGAFEVSAWQMPLLVTTVVASLAVGRLLARSPAGLGRILAVGFAAFVAGYTVLGLVGPNTSPGWFVPGMVLIGIGMSAVSVPQSVMFVAQAPQRFFGAVTSFRTTVGQLGYAIGLAGSVALVQILGQSSFVSRMAESGVQPAALGSDISEVKLFVMKGTEPTTQAGREALQAAADAYAGGFNTTMLVTAAVMTILGLATVLLLARSRRSHGDTTAT